MTKLERYKAFKDQFSTAEESFAWYEANASRPELGIYNLEKGSRKISLRVYDDTPSVAIYDRLSYVDFGGDGTQKDPLFRVMEVTKKPFAQALDLILSWEGGCSTEFTPKARNCQKEEQRSAFSNNYIREMVINRSKLNDKYLTLVPGLFRSCSKQEIANAEKLFSIGFSPKSEYESEDRIFIPEFDSGGIAWGCYKYNRSSGKKGLLRKNSKRVIFGSHLLKKFKNDIILSEGHTDVIVNVAKNLASVTTGSSTKKFNENIEILAGKTLHDFPDLDIAGMLGAINRGLEIEAFNKANPDKKITHIVYWWAQWFFDEKLAIKLRDENGVAPSELFYFIKDQIPIKKDRAFFNIDILAILQEAYIEKKKIVLPDYLRIHNWKIMSKGSKKAGYDWIDFHTENGFNEKYESFIEKFRF